MKQPGEQRKREPAEFSVVPSSAADFDHQGTPKS